MKKAAKILSIIMISGVIISCIVWFAGKAIWNSIREDSHTITTDKNAYQGREGFFDEEYTGYWSHLLIFPEKDLETMNIEKYYYERDILSMDTIYKMLLVYTLDEEEFQEEKQRLADISMKYNGKEQKIQYTENMFQYPAYIAAYEKAREYEYAMANDEENQIVCVYYQMSNLEEEIITSEYMPMQNPEFSEFNIYFFQIGERNYVMPDLSGEEIICQSLR